MHNAELISLHHPICDNFRYANDKYFTFFIESTTLSHDQDELMLSSHSYQVWSI